MMKVKQTNQRKMKTKFFSLVARISTTLDQRMSLELDEQNGGEIFQRFREYVSGVCNDGSIASKATVREIFGVIRDRGYWDIDGQPYDLLLSIVEEVEDEELIAAVENGHKNYYTQYLVTTKVADHIFEYQRKKLVEAVAYMPNLKQLSVKLDGVTVDECSMAYLTDLWKAVKCCVQLPDLFSVLADIEKGCLSVTWLVPTYVVPALTRLSRYSQELYRKFCIKKMNINGVCFYEVGCDI